MLELCGWFGHLVAWVGVIFAVGAGCARWGYGAGSKVACGMVKVGGWVRAV